MTVDACTVQSRVYADVNEKMGRAWWDYGQCLLDPVNGVPGGEHVREGRLRRHELTSSLPPSLPCLASGR